MKIVYVEWWDSVSPGKGVWSSKSNSEECTPDLIKSIGYLVKETKDRVTIAGHDGSFEYSGVMVIPRCSIKKMKRIKI